MHFAKENISFLILAKASKLTGMVPRAAVKRKLTFSKVVFEIQSLPKSRWQFQPSDWVKKRI